MRLSDDSALLRRYVEDHTDEAFDGLVARHINLVYSVALRQVGDPHHAEEVTQAVFIILAKKAGQLRHDKALSSWLFQTTRLTAANLVRSESRRRHREQEAYMQSTLNESGADVWPSIAPLLDTAVAGLGEKDRRAIVLRFYEGRSVREVGMALGASEDAAEKRVTRAVERLRRFFTKRGVTLTAAAIAGAVSANSVHAAPAGLAAAATAAAAKGAAVSGSTLTLIKGALKIMAWTKAKTAIVVGVGLLLATVTTEKFISMGASSPPAEPTYENKTLRQWIAAYPRLEIISLEDTVAYRRTALLAMGAPAVRYLHWMITHPQQSLDEHRSPNEQQMTPASRRNRANFMNVVCAVMDIGPNASKIAPDLVRLWEGDGNPMYSTYNGFPTALAELGDASPDIIAALHRHFTSPDLMHAALCALAAWRLNPDDVEAASMVRRSLSPDTQDTRYGGSTAYVVLDSLGKAGANASSFTEEIHKLINESVSASFDHQAIAALAAWRIFHTPDQAVEAIKRMKAVAAKPDATASEVSAFAAATLNLKEVASAREAAIPILMELRRYPDKSTAEFCSNILERLEAVEGR